MTRIAACLVLACTTVFAAATPARAQTQQPDAACWVQGDRATLPNRASPLDSASVTLGAGTLKMCYGRPQMRGRTVMGGLVPFNEPWRLGANEATTIHVPVRARVAGVSVQPGWYSIYVVPARSAWRIVVNRTAQRWGIPIDSAVQAADVGSGTVPVQQTASPVEQLTASFQKTGANTADLVVEWERTRVRIPVVLQPASGG